MICRVGETVRRGRAVTVEGVGARAVARAVRNGPTESTGTTVAVTARIPHPVHERVGCLGPEMGLRVRTALAAAARARGYATRYDRQLERLQAKREEIDPEPVTTDDTRRALAAISDDRERLREQAATVRGRLQARREAGLATEPVAERLRGVAQDLSETETTVTAKRQRLERERRRAREARDDLERRLRIEDRIANLRREARSVLVERTREAYTLAVEDTPGGPSTVEDPFDVDTVTAGLAIARIADFEAPVVVDVARFESAREASRWLGAPVIYIG